MLLLSVNQTRKVCTNWSESKRHFFATFCTIFFTILAHYASKWVKVRELMMMIIISSPGTQLVFLTCIIASKSGKNSTHLYKLWAPDISFARSVFNGRLSEVIFQKSIQSPIVYTTFDEGKYLDIHWCKNLIKLG